MPFSHYAISFLTDDIIRMRYVEIDGQLRKVMVVIKMRGGNHSKDIREYVITDKGVVVIHPRRTDYDGLTTGIPQRTGPRRRKKTKPRRNRRRRGRAEYGGETNAGHREPATRLVESPRRKQSRVDAPGVKC